MIYKINKIINMRKKKWKKYQNSVLKKYEIKQRPLQNKTFKKNIIN